ncbi:CAF17-like 4Fe-4S cluster assembly/insertion protein YgfZ [Moraxella marmotae]|uniref:CAF17-like 4Fe-4S cluster assembly/insertion protein YgfZ n=1 Tax=Moraxella marmotae TaxID=3344520 RepID=UPI0035F45F61
MNQPISEPTEPQFGHFVMSGVDAEKFLQGQVTADVHKLTQDFVPTAICNLKGRVQFGLWLQKTETGFGIVISQDMQAAFTAHVKKFGAFSKIALSDAKPIYPAIIDGVPSFDTTDHAQSQAWQQLSIAQGNYWLTAATSELYQPQELRLHQRGGVAYDKGCYLGQEIIARLYFKSSPKAYLHRVAGTGTPPAAGSDVGKVSIINSIATDTGFEALVIARPDELSDLSVLDLPSPLQAAVGRDG